MNMDPTYGEMVAHLQKVMPELDAFDTAKAIHYFATSHHGGQASNLYEALSVCGYKPGMAENAIEFGSEIEMAYNELAIEFASKDYIATRAWNNQERAKRGAAALKAYLDTISEQADRQSCNDDIENLMIDLLHLAATHDYEQSEIDFSGCFKTFQDEEIELPGDAIDAAAGELANEGWEALKPDGYIEVKKPQ